MLKIDITADNPALQELAAAVTQLGQKGLLPATEEAFYNGARMIRDVWQDYAAGRKELSGVPAMKKPSHDYAAGVKIKQDGAMAYTVSNTSKAAPLLEYGTEGYDMKLTHPYGKKSRVGLHWNKKTKMLERVPYLIVPFSWGTPKTVSFHRTMSEDLYDIVRRLKKSTVTGETHFEDNWAGEAIARHEYEFKGRYKTDDKTGDENGMVRMSDLATGKSSYFTFRVISARSPQNSWLQKGIPARHVTEGLKRECDKAIVSTIQEALKTDLGE